MKNKVAAIAVLFICLPVIADTHSPDPETWYIKDYAALWESNPGENIDAILSHYNDVVVTHSADGSVMTTPAQEWLGPPMQEWLADGWLNANLQKVITDRINASTASFKASWVDRYDGSEDEVSCGWYLADLRDGRWAFTGYADLDCAEHGL
ncbi:MAG: hypothetical protein ACJAYC_003852 [Halieaceae bacterium]|jgi:hypothetical protein